MLALPLFEVLFLGFLCGLIPGPIVTALLAETIRSGSHSARRIVAWAGMGELLMGVVCVAALSLVSPDSPILAVLSTFGALLLFNLALELWRVEEISDYEPLFTNRRVFTLSIMNGMAWIFWITVCAPMAMALDQQLSNGRWIFILLFELGWIASTLILCYFFGLFRPFFQSNKKLHLLYRTVSLLFIVFAIKLAVGSGQALLH